MKLLQTFQKVAVEAIVHSASKKDKCTGLLGNAVPILKKLYHEGADDAIKVRALVVSLKLLTFCNGQFCTKETKYLVIYGTRIVQELL